MVVATDAYAAADAAARSSLDAEPLPAVTSVEAAADGGAAAVPRARHQRRPRGASGRDDPLAGAEVVVRARLEHPRLAPVPLETSAILAEPDGDGLLVHLSTQSVFDARVGARGGARAARGDDPRDRPRRRRRLRPEARDAVEHVCVAHAARLLGRPVRYAETRGESMLALPHGRGQVQHFAIGARPRRHDHRPRRRPPGRPGRLPAVALRRLDDAADASGAYAIPAIRARIRSVVTNATPTAPLRGAGRPEAAALVERAVDLLAAELGLDPVAVRRRNLVAAGRVPVPHGGRLDVRLGRLRARARPGARAGRLRRTPGASRRRGARRGDRRLLGHRRRLLRRDHDASRGPSTPPWPSAADGAVAVAVGVSPQGQGHETTFAQVASATLGVPIERVRVRPLRHGAGGARAGDVRVPLAAGGRLGACWSPAREVDEQARAVAAGLLEADVADVVRDGRPLPRARRAGAVDHARAGGRGRRRADRRRPRLRPRRSRRSRSGATPPSSSSTPTPATCASCAWPPSTTPAGS